MHQVTFSKTDDRAAGVKALILASNTNPVKNKDVLIKPNFNTADPAPGSTHNDTLVTLIDEVWSMGAKSIALGERSYPPTLEVMQQKGIIPLLEQRDVRIINFDDLSQNDWIEFKPDDGHWPKGFRIARPILEAESLVCTCCLKTHQFGGVFTMSLKLAVGAVPTSRHGFHYMGDLHSSRHQQQMIAEINRPFVPDLVILDGVEAFVDGGPASGKRFPGNVMLASSDRVALDAVGVAVLKLLGSNAAIMQPKIFEQKQIARAAELGIGVASPSEIDLVAVDQESRAYCEQTAQILRQG